MAEKKTKRSRGCLKGCGLILFVTAVALYGIGSSKSPTQSLRSVAATATNLSTEVTAEEEAMIAIPATTYYALSGANLRSCPRTNCDRIDTATAGESLVVTGSVNGEVINADNALWYRVSRTDGDAYIYSNLVSTNRPVPTSANSNGSGFSCPSNCDGARAMGLSAQQAGTCPRLDRDNDGVACYGD